MEPKDISRNATVQECLELARFAVACMQMTAEQASHDYRAAKKTLAALEDALEESEGR